MTETQVALVTGANKGIGYATAAGLVERGYAVMVAARDAERGERAAAALRASGGDARSVVLEVTDDASVAVAASSVTERFGRLDVLVNNAGVSGGVSGQRPGAVDPAVLIAVLDTNVVGAARVTDAFLPLLLRSAAPRIVNVTSGLGSLTRMSDPADYFTAVPAVAAYPASKSALNALTVQYAKALRDRGVLVNAADPGPCRTDFTSGVMPATRTAAEGARIVVRLATLPDDGPTGGCFAESGPVPW